MEKKPNKKYILKCEWDGGIACWVWVWENKKIYRKTKKKGWDDAGWAVEFSVEFTEKPGAFVESERVKWSYKWGRRLTACGWICIYSYFTRGSWKMWRCFCYRDIKL